MLTFYVSELYLLKMKTLKLSNQLQLYQGTSSTVEARYRQLDLEAVEIDFALTQFTTYLVCAPGIELVTDHKLFYPVFNTHRQISIRTDRIKIGHQHINYLVTYQKGMQHKSDYITRHGKLLSSLPDEEQRETEDLHN